jgi:hypothetical protein
MKDPVLIKINIINSIDGEASELEIPLQKNNNGEIYFITVERF